MVLAALALPTAALGQSPTRIEAGRAALEAGDTARARAAFTEAVSQGDPAEAALGEYHLAHMADEALDFPAALAGYRRFVARDPGSRYASRALARIDDLQAHAEGGFAPLAALERVRRSTALSDDPRALEALDRASQGWPAGSVRAEAWMLVAEAYAGRMRRPRPAAEVFLRLAEDEQAPAQLREADNRDDGWQGAFRVGWFDAVATRYAIEANGGVEALAVTCVDGLADEREWKIATAYRMGDGARVRSLTLGARGDLAQQARMTAALRAATAEYRVTTTAGDAAAHVAAMAEETGVAVGLVSTGPRARDKRWW